MKYLVVLPQAGTPGDVWVPRPGVDAAALVAGGFIRPVDGVEDDAPRTSTGRKVTRKERT